MKKLIPILTVMALVFAVGVVYADEGASMAKEDLRIIVLDDTNAYAAVDNGVTFVSLFDTGIKCLSEGGAAAGGMESKELRGIVKDDMRTYNARDNGVSFTAEIPEATCSWARGMSPELHNVITVPGGNL